MSEDAKSGLIGLLTLLVFVYAGYYIGYNSGRVSILQELKDIVEIDKLTGGFRCK